MTSTVEEVLAVERKKTNFSTTKMRDFLYGSEMVKTLAQIRQKHAYLPYDFNIFNEGRVQILKEGYRNLQLCLKDNSLEVTQQNFLYLILQSVHQIPGSVHVGMFIKCIEFMGTDTQQAEYLEKCRNLEIIGGYAQTEMAHGSDVQNLETTATYIQGSDEFIIDTPSISAAKFWPGELGISANYALVFAQLIVKGQKYGIQSFLVRIRDDDHKPMPGIEVGDIGPKIGYHAKDNGYLLMHKVRIPKRNMLRRFISVSKRGEIKKKGDPKVSYATMMTIRMYISCTYPKAYSQVITIATRYSMFRRQFKNKANQEIPVIEYQLQQQKLIPRVAQFYAVIIAGNNIRKLCLQNFRYVKEKENFSLMAETHACLCFSKSFFSQTVFYGMQICRRACGGQGYSHYSGMPSIYYEYAANLTHQGQNTILYLQTARYLLKSYKHSVTKKKPLGESVKYIQSYDFLMSKKCQVHDANKWSLQDLRILLAQSVCHLISIVIGKIMSKQEGQSDMDVLNHDTGIRLQQMSIAHACYYTFNSFRQAAALETDQAMNEVITNMCMLYGINTILIYAGHVIEGGFVNPEQIGYLKTAKQNLLKKIRPQLIGLVDSFDLTEQQIRSELTYGNPYQNFYNMAKKCSLNREIQEAAIIVKDGIREALKPKL